MPAPQTLHRATMFSNNNNQTHRIRLVPHLDSRRTLRFEPITRDLKDNDIPLHIGHFTDRSGIGLAALSPLSHIRRSQDVEVEIEPELELEAEAVSSPEEDDDDELDRGGGEKDKLVPHMRAMRGVRTLGYGLRDMSSMLNPNPKHNQIHNVNHTRTQPPKLIHPVMMQISPKS
ncbi:uncharacterized protein HD556DRAFT_1471182 [Suillus plorans]|uniref:Uncharacterized protein n=1 Tax=Suillus plorans TaxID=116603 RepID=A0A9P7DJM7_9AGAM|nr:uncharacterized protein HD556DRAFT_1471182 [Suillus plorans]KAG1795955.1 hypothetical protein HD556DRAFT_1471182 [Suillus plorans]